MNSTIRVGGEEISHNDPRVQRWQLHSRLLTMLRDVLNREDVQACRQVVKDLVDADYIQPLWQQLCQITEQTTDTEVLNQIRAVKGSTQFRFIRSSQASDRASGDHERDV